ncbi:MAG: M48 family metallopeptidase [Cyclobacteriaceae bacterium]|nr:M48 family metallopeptidase [Cyclobacteriaceae bacterium]
MAPETLLFVIIGIVSFEFIFGQVLEYINLKTQKRDIPPEVEKFYDKEKYLKSLQYKEVNTKFSFITSTFSFLITLSLLFFGGFGYLDSLLRPVIENEIILSLTYFGILFVLSDLINIPFQWYGTFVIEEKFGFNMMKAGTFVMDKLKGYLLAIIIGGLLGSSLLWLILEIGKDFWWYFWVLISVFMLFMQMFYSSLILPLFNKLTPLEDADLRSAIVNYCNKVDFPLTHLFVMDGSKRSKKSNAFFMGIGKKKKIVLYDTLVKNHSIEELVSILAHEVGHYKKKHIISGLVITILQTGFILFILSLFVYNENLSFALGSDMIGIHLNLIAFSILYSPLSSLTGIVMNMYSRKNEFEADAFARKTYKAEPLKEALKKLSVDNLSNLYPHPFYVFIHYSHPPLLVRLKALDAKE